MSFFYWRTRNARKYDLIVVKNFLLYACGSILVRGSSIIVAPFTMAMLSPADYGLLALINSSISICVAIIGCGLRQVLSIEYFHYDADEQKKIINDIISIYLICGVPLLLCGIWAIYSYPTFFFAHTISWYVISIAAFTSFIYFFVELFYQLLQYSGKAFELTLLQICTAALTIAITLVFLGLFKWGVESILFAQLIGMMLVFVCALSVYIKHRMYELWQITKSFEFVSTYLRIGVPFIPPLLLSIILGSGNRFILAHYATLDDVGIYAIADSCGQLFNAFILYPFSGSYHPYILYTYAHNKNNIRDIEYTNQRIMWITICTLIVCISAGYVLFKSWLHIFFPPHYYQVIRYIPYILYGSVFLLGQYFASAFIQFQKCTWFLSCVLIIPAGVNSVLGYILIPSFKIYGCLIASVFSYALFFMITLAYNRYILKKM